MMNYSSQKDSIADSSTMATLKSDEMDATYNSHENETETNDYNNNNDKAEQNSNTAETSNPLAQISFSPDKVDYEKVAGVVREIHTKITIPTNEADSSLSNQTTSNLANKDSNIIWLDIKSDTDIKSFGDLNNSKHHSEIVDINTSTTPWMNIKSSADLMSTNLSLISNNSNNSQLLSNIKANKNFNELFENISSENKTANNSGTESIAVSGTSMRQTMPITHFENLIPSTTNSILNENISKLHQSLTGTKISSNTNSTNNNSEQNTKADANITTPEDSLLVSEANQQKVSKKEKPIKGTKTQHVSTPVQTDSTSVATSNRRCLEAPSQCDENLMILLAQRKTYKQPAAYFVFFLRTPIQNVFV
ncbi:probable cyclin-dependent serine/threonine-protein kinase DDB_G0292550 [Teleopsis dalmanni]|uniref:probable cyclin-dependent serine/threonine-protein kinase DDB_G0292550 n=1 Tax=Teleopsis dalmanni TaxID=139649 RepID=UPI0018CF716F|nr:probable cyclin-dependent serine/threonine-protein kinase DDB_G0292550 [Teleopsis dalmanni]